MLEFIDIGAWSRRAGDVLWSAALPGELGGEGLAQLTAIWSATDAAAPISLSPADGLVRRRWAGLHGATFSLVAALGPLAGRGLSALCARPPEIVTWRLSPRAAPGASGGGLFPATLHPRARPEAARARDLRSVADSLEKHDLDGVLELAADLVLSGASEELAEVTRSLAVYLVTHPLHRSDRVAMFVGAISGYRSFT